MWQYGLRGLVSGGALASASLVLEIFGTVAAPLPDRGLAAPSRGVMAAPAALPDVPEPAATPPAAPAEQYAWTVTVPVQVPTPATLSRAPQLAFAAWATRLARITGIPARALEAYANAHAIWPPAIRAAASPG